MSCLCFVRKDKCDSVYRPNFGHAYQVLLQLLLRSGPLITFKVRDLSVLLAVYIIVCDWYLILVMKRKELNSLLLLKVMKISVVFLSFY